MIYVRPESGTSSHAYVKPEFGISTHTLENPPCPSVNKTWRSYLSEAEKNMANYMKKNQPDIYNEAKARFIEKIVKEHS